MSRKSLFVEVHNYAVDSLFVWNRPAVIAICNRIFHVENCFVQEVEKPANLATETEEPPVQIEATWHRRHFVAE